MIHYTNVKGWKAIRSQVDWTFKSHKPPDDHAKGAYFTTFPPGTRNLASLLGIPKTKIEFAFCFRGIDGLSPIRGPRGQQIFYCSENYLVKKPRQEYEGLAETGDCS